MEPLEPKCVHIVDKLAAAVAVTAAYSSSCRGCLEEELKRLYMKNLNVNFGLFRVKAAKMAVLSPKIIF